MGRKFDFTHKKGTKLVALKSAERVRRLNSVKHCDANIAVTQMRTNIVISSMGL